MALEKKRVDYINGYAKEHYRQYNFRVSYELDGDIINAIEEMRNAGVPANAYIRECIRASINNDTFTEYVLEKKEQLKASRF